MFLPMISPFCLNCAQLVLPFHWTRVLLCDWCVVWILLSTINCCPLSATNCSGIQNVCHKYGNGYFWCQAIQSEHVVLKATFCQEKDRQSQGKTSLSWLWWIFLLCNSTLEGSYILQHKPYIFKQAVHFCITTKRVVLTIPEGAESGVVTIHGF